MSLPGPLDAALIALLSDPVTANLSDDELGRRAGVRQLPLSGGQSYVMTFRLEFAEAKRVMPDDPWRAMGLAHIFRKDLIESGGYSESDLEEIIAYLKKWRADRAEEDAFRAANGLPVRTTIKPRSLQQEEEREAKRQTKLAKAADRERAKAARAAAREAKRQAKRPKQQLDIEDAIAATKADPRQINLEDLIDTIDKDPA
jgi:hypothetical protein